MNRELPEKIYFNPLSITQKEPTRQSPRSPMKHVISKEPMVVIPIGMDCRDPMQPNPWRLKNTDRSQFDLHSLLAAGEIGQVCGENSRVIELARLIHEGLQKADKTAFISPIEDIEGGEVIVDGYFDLLVVARHILSDFAN